MQPYGVQRGTATEVTIQGANLAGNPRLIASVPVVVEPPSEPKEDAANWVAKLTVDPSVPVGVYPIRVATDDGLSNPILLAVGQLPQVSETEPNNEPAAAQAVAAPIVVEGQAAGNDVDHVRFPGTKGQRIVIDAACARIGSGVDPQIRLTTAKGAYVASADDTAGLLTDARLVADLPEDGDYILEISDTRYQGGGRAVYRLTIGAVPLADSVYPLGGRRGETVGFELRGGTLPDGVRTAAATLAAPPDRDDFRPRITAGQLGLTDTSLDVELPGSLAISNHPELREPAGDETPLKAAPPAVLNGRIDPEGDEDRFVVVVTPGRKYRARVEAASLGSALDGQLRALKPDGGEIAQGDDNTLKIVVDDPAKPVDVISPDPSLEFTPPEGVTEVTLALRDLSGRGASATPTGWSLNRPTQALTSP